MSYSSYIIWCKQTKWTTCDWRHLNRGINVNMLELLLAQLHRIKIWLERLYDILFWTLQICKCEYVFTIWKTVKYFFHHKYFWYAGPRAAMP